MCVRNTFKKHCCWKVTTRGLAKAVLGFQHLVNEKCLYIYQKLKMDKTNTSFCQKHSEYDGHNQRQRPSSLNITKTSMCVCVHAFFVSFFFLGVCVCFVCVCVCVCVCMHFVHVRTCMGACVCVRACVHVCVYDHEES